MKYKRTVIAAAMTLAAAASIYYMSGRGASPERRADELGVVNPDVKTVGMSREPMPQLSERRFEPKPSVAVGSHMDPNYKSKK